MAEPKAGHGTDANDTLHRFLFERLGIRGELVRLGASWRALHAGHDYPAPVRAQLGRAVAASVLLSATIKFDGNLILQAQGDGPLGMLVAQATSRRTFRGLAHWHGAVPEGDLATMHGVGRLVMTLEPSGDGERYQGIVPLEGATLAAADFAYSTTIVERALQRREPVVVPDVTAVLPYALASSARPNFRRKRMSATSPAS